MTAPDYNEYAEWLSRISDYPDLGPGSEVILLPPELGGGTIRGKIKWENGSHDSWAISIPYGADGALIYVHKADVAPVSTMLSIDESHEKEK